MRVSGVSGGSEMQTRSAAISPGMGDEISKGLQKQIENLQKQMKELSANQEMTPDMKMKKRQELQKQISELQIQLRQHQMEVKREEARKREEKEGQDDVLNPAKGMEQRQEQRTGLSAGSMEAMISADASMKQAGVHGSTARQAQNKAGILEAEIKRDKGGPGDASAAKEEVLTETKALAEKASASQMESLSKANEVAEKALEADKQKKDDKEEDNGKAEEAGRENETDHAAEHDTVPVYHPVDVRI